MSGGAKEIELAERTGIEGRRIRDLISEHSRDLVSGQKGFCQIKREERGRGQLRELTPQTR